MVIAALVAWDEQQQDGGGNTTPSIEQEAPEGGPDASRGVRVWPSSLRPPATALHVVQPGESLSSIAGAYGATVEEILALNNIPEPDTIVPGQQIAVPADRR
jgi:LysM repeat protein